MWELYLKGCEIAFRHQDLMVFQIQLAKSKEAVPLTRDYIQRLGNGARREAKRGGGIGRSMPNLVRLVQVIHTV